MLTVTLFDNVSLDQDRVSRAIRLRHSNVERISFHSLISGVPDGNLLVQVSNDLGEDDDLVSNWVDYTDSMINLTGITQAIVNVKDLTFRWIRLVYINNAGSGLISTNVLLVKRYS